MYVAVKGGERAIDNAHRLLAEKRRGDPDLPVIATEQIEQQLSISMARVMSEASLYAPSLAALALKQARGDTIEAVFLLRAYRTTLPRFGYSRPIDTSQMRLERRISATYKDLPGGQVLGPTFDYTHRLLDAALAGSGSGISDGSGDVTGIGVQEESTSSVAVMLEVDGLVEQEIPLPNDPEPGDITRTPMEFPASRDIRLQALARGDEGFLLSLAYSTQRGYGRTHPFVGEIRVGWVSIELDIPELGLVVDIGEIQITECQMINQFKGSDTEPPKFTRGYGLVFGHAERKAMAMSLIDRSLRARELGEILLAPAQDEEFVLAHSDNVQASGFVEHLKLPHYVDFQAELELLRRLQKEQTARDTSKS